MKSSPVDVSPGEPCDLRFQSLFDVGRSYAFPCDAAGRVELDSLSDRARESYLYARTMVGREVSYPVVMHRSDH